VKQPYNTTIYNTALYLRLSRDDELQGESGSIQTQRMMCLGSMPQSMG
jgi:site-specific DNA recombinase